MTEVLDDLAAMRTAIRRAVVDYTADAAVDHLRREACHAIERLGLAVAAVESRGGAA